MGDSDNSPLGLARHYETIEVTTDVSKRAGRSGAGWSIRGMNGSNPYNLERGGCVLENDISTAEGEYAAALRGIYRANEYDASCIVLLTDFDHLVEYVNNPSIDAASNPPHAKYITRIRRNLFEYDTWKVVLVPRQNVKPAHEQSRIACPTVDSSEVV